MAEDKYAALAAQLSKLNASIRTLDASVTSATNAHECATDVAVTLGSFLSTNPGSFVACKPIPTTAQTAAVAAAAPKVR